MNLIRMLILQSCLSKYLVRKPNIESHQNQFGSRPPHSRASSQPVVHRIIIIIITSDYRIISNYLDYIYNYRNI